MKPAFKSRFFVLNFDQILGIDSPEFQTRMEQYDSEYNFYIKNNFPFSEKLKFYYDIFKHGLGVKKRENIETYSILKFITCHESKTQGIKLLEGLYLNGRSSIKLKNNPLAEEIGSILNLGKASQEHLTKMYRANLFLVIDKYIDQFINLMEKTEENHFSIILIVSSFEKIFISHREYINKKLALRNMRPFEENPRIILVKSFAEHLNSKDELLNKAIETHNLDQKGVKIISLYPNINLENIQVVRAIVHLVSYNCEELEWYDNALLFLRSDVFPEKMTSRSTENLLKLINVVNIIGLPLPMPKNKQSLIHNNIGLPLPIQRTNILRTRS